MKLTGLNWMAVLLLLQTQVWADEKAEKAHAVATAEVSHYGLEVEKIYPVTVKLKQVYTVSSQLSATVEKVFIEAGQRVKQGDALLLLLNPSLNLLYQQKKWHWLQAQQDLQRLQALENKKWVSAAQIADAETGLKIAKLEKEDAAVELAKLNIVALFAGEIRQRWVEAGENVSKDQALFELVNPNSLYLSSNMPLAVAQQVDRQQTVKVLINGLSIDAVVRAVVLPVVANSAYAQVELAVPLAIKQKLSVGEWGQLTLTQGLAPTLNVPLAALRYEANGAYVWRVDAEKNAQRLSVMPRYYGREQVAIDGELQAGDVVVVKGFMGLKQGMLVQAFD